MRLFLFFLWVSALISPALAEPRSYRLDPAESKVEFTYQLSGAPGKGTMPITRADLRLDFANVPASQATVSLDVAGARTGALFVTQALKSPEVLHAAAHPRIQFRSRKVTGSLRDGARITGDVTVRGVTRPLVLDAQVYRRQGSQSGDLSRLTVILTGSLNRSAFGASGYPDLVADRVDLRILARISETP